MRRSSPSSSGGRPSRFPGQGPLHQPLLKAVGHLLHRDGLAGHSQSDRGWRVQLEVGRPGDAHQAARVAGAGGVKFQAEPSPGEGQRTGQAVEFAGGEGFSERPVDLKLVAAADDHGRLGQGRVMHERFKRALRQRLVVVAGYGSLSWAGRRPDADPEVQILAGDQIAAASFPSQGKGGGIDSSTLLFLGGAET